MPNDLRLLIITFSLRHICRPKDGETLGKVKDVYKADSKVMKKDRAKSRGLSKSRVGQRRGLRLSLCPTKNSKLI